MKKLVIFLCWMVATLYTGSLYADTSFIIQPYRLASSCTTPNASISYSSTTPFTVGDSDRAITSACAGGGSPTLSTNNSSICTVVSGALHAVGAGSCSVYADCSAAGEYCADRASQGITITGGTTASDDFNRANGGLGANWTTITGESASSISSNGVVGPSGARGGAYWNANTFSANQCSQVTVVTTSNAAAAAVRISTSAETYYYFGAGTGGAGKLNKRVAGTATQIGTDYALIANGDVVKLCVSGSTLTPYINGVAQTPQTDSAIASGQPGIYLFNNLAKIDDWSAQDLP